MAKVKNIAIKNARIIFRNFAGKNDKYNTVGRRQFGVVIDPDAAQDLIEEGWHIKFLKPRDDEETPTPYLPVRVSFAVSAPAMYLITKKKKNVLTEDKIAMLDNAEFEKIDLEISPYYWTMPTGESGITAYLKTGYFTIVEDPFYEDYAKYDDPSGEEIPFE